jgi:CubicO group peptidase (beta-lactamase class C family)
VGHPFLGALLLFVIGAAGWSLAWLWRVTAIGAAYKAKILCTTIFGSGREIDLRRADEISADSYWPLRFFGSRIDRVERSVTVSFLGLRPRTAIDRPGLGATLVRAGRPAELSIAPTASSSTSRTPTRPWPVAIGSPRLQQVVESAFTEPDPNRLRRTRAVVVVRNGRIVAERYAPGISSKTPLPGWSMTKSVLGALVGILVGDDRLSLDDRELVPEWRAPDPRAEIELEDLLRMRSGLKFSEVYSDLSSDVVKMLFGSPDTAAYAASQPLISPRGTTWNYSSGTTNILSSIVRRVVGDSEYLGWPRRALFDPIGMSSAVMEPDAAGTFVCSSFMLAVARDWARFGQLYLQDGVWNERRVLPDGWVRYSTTPTPQSPGSMYGAHWWLKLGPELGGGTDVATRIPTDAFFALGHEGQTLTVIPSLELVVVRLGLTIHLDAWNHAAFLADLQDALS